MSPIVACPSGQSIHDVLNFIREMEMRMLPRIILSRAIGLIGCCGVLLFSFGAIFEVVGMQTGEDFSEPSAATTHLPDCIYQLEMIGSEGKCVVRSRNLGVQVRDLVDGAIIESTRSDTADGRAPTEVCALAGNTVFVGERGGTAYLFDVADPNRETYRWSIGQNPVLDSDFHESSGLLAILTGELNRGTVVMWDVERRRTLLAVDVPASCSICFMDDGKHVVVGGADEMIIVAVADGKRESLPTPSVGSIHCLSVSPDGRFAVIGGIQGAVQLWDLESRTRMWEHRPNGLGFCTADFNSDGSVVAAAGTDRVVRCWETQSGREIAAIRDHDDVVRSLHFTFDGQALLSAGHDGRVMKHILEDHWVSEPPAPKTATVGMIGMETRY